MKVVDTLKIEDEYFAVVKHNEEAFLAHIEGLCRAKYNSVTEENIHRLIEEIKQNQDCYVMTSSIKGEHSFYKFYIVER